MAYLEDCYPDMVLEGIVGVAVINNTIEMIFTFAATPWFTASGTLNTWIAVGTLSFGFIMITCCIGGNPVAGGRWGGVSGL